MRINPPRQWFPVRSERDPDKWEVYDAHDNLVAIVFGESNARLTASAPDLADACRQMTTAETCQQGVDAAYAAKMALMGTELETSL